MCQCLSLAYLLVDGLLHATVESSPIIRQTKHVFYHWWAVQLAFDPVLWCHPGSRNGAVR